MHEMRTVNELLGAAEISNQNPPFIRRYCIALVDVNLRWNRSDYSHQHRNHRGHWFASQVERVLNLTKDPFYLVGKEFAMSSLNCPSTLLFSVIAVTLGTATLSYGEMECDGDLCCDADEGLCCKLDSDSGALMRVCVKWEEEDAPAEITDFVIDYDCTDCSSAPEVTLKANTSQWTVWSENISTGQPLNPIDPADLGDLRVDGTYDFNLLLSNAGEPGAKNAALIDITPSGDNHGQLVTGSEVEEDVAGNVNCPADSSNEGGVVNLAIQGSLSGNVSCYQIASLEIGYGGGTGNLSGNLTVDEDITVTVRRITS
jgi:hypothetical protein